MLDFGLAKMVADRRPENDASLQPTRMAERVLTNPGTTMGTIAYMSPEQARGEDTVARSDIFSFGVVLYEMATGRPAFSGRTAAVITDELLNKQPVAARAVNPECPIGFDTVIARALEKEPERRYQRVSDLRADLERVKRAQVVGAAAAPTARPASESRRRVLAIASGVAVMLAVASALGWRWIRSGSYAGPIDSIAVLPFVNAGGTADADYLSDGLAETLTNSLTQVKGLRVVPRTLAAKYRNATIDPREAGTALERSRGCHRPGDSARRSPHGPS